MAALFDFIDFYFSPVPTSLFCRKRYLPCSPGFRSGTLSLLSRSGGLALAGKPPALFFQNRIVRRASARERSSFFIHQGKLIAVMHFRDVIPSVYKVVIVSKITLRVMHQTETVPCHFEE